MIANHVKQRLGAGRPAFGSSLLNVGDPLVGMLNDQRFLFAAAKAARDAVRTEA